MNSFLSDEDRRLLEVLQELGYTADEAADMLLWHQCAMREEKVQ